MYVHTYINSCYNIYSDIIYLFTFRIGSSIDCHAYVHKLFTYLHIIYLTNIICAKYFYLYVNYLFTMCITLAIELTINLLAFSLHNRNYIRNYIYIKRKKCEFINLENFNTRKIFKNCGICRSFLFTNFREYGMLSEVYW